MTSYQVSHRVRFHSVHSHRCCCAETPKQATTGAEEHCWGTGGRCEGVLHVKVDLQRHTRVSPVYRSATNYISGVLSQVLSKMGRPASRVLGSSKTHAWLRKLRTR